MNPLVASIEKAARQRRGEVDPLENTDSPIVRMALRMREADQRRRR
jgi:hypothetical protein